MSDMEPRITSEFEHIALDGPIGLAAAVTVCLCLLAVFAVALWRERRILGERNTILFWLLRAATVATVLWMLLAPMKVRTETSTTRKAIAVITDVSGSMQTVDPPHPAEDLRWAIAGGVTDTSTLELADRATAAVGMALGYVDAAADALTQHKPVNVVAESTAAAANALQRAAEHIDRVRPATDPTGAARDAANRATDLKSSAEFADFFRLSSALERGRTPAQKGWQESLPDLRHRVQALHRTLEDLVYEIGEAAARKPRIANQARLNAVVNASRLERAADFVQRMQKSVFDSVRKQADVRLAAFDDSVGRLANPEAPATELKDYATTTEDFSAAEQPPASTDITGLLEQLKRDSRDQPLAAVFVVSDVRHSGTTEIDPREAAAALNNTPVYVVPTGNTKHIRDIVLQSVHAPHVAMRNDDIVIEARIQAYDCDGESCVVQLMDDGRVVDFREVTLDSSVATRTVRFEQQMPAIGHQRFQVSVPPLDGEATPDNNFAEVEVDVTRSDIKLLLSDHMPRWEYRYLSQLFRRDPKIECDELLFNPRIIATGRREESRSFPVTVDEWDQYDAVVLGDLPTESLSVAAQETLIEYLHRRGGTLVMVAGTEAMPQAYSDHPLGEILPVTKLQEPANDTRSFAFRVTDEGRNHHALMIGESDEATRIAWDFVNRFSPLYGLSPWRKPRPSARTLIAAVPRDSVDETADAASSAFLCWQPVGRGRIVYLSGPDTYRLRFLRGDRLHYRFWGQMLRWAIASDLSTGSEFVRIRTDRSRYGSRDDVNVTVRLADGDGQPVAADDLELQLTSNGKALSLPLITAAEIPGEYRATIRSLSAGVYRVETVGATIERLQQNNVEPAAATFTIESDRPRELIDTRADRPLAQQIADITGGQVIPPTAVAEVLELTNLEPIVSERVETRPLWLEWKFLWIVFGCLQTEWVMRKWKGLS